MIIYYKRVADTGFSTASTAIEKLAMFNQELGESDLTMYEGIEVTGNDVVNLIKKCLGSFDATEQADFYIRVITSSVDRSYRNNADLASIQDFSSALYIKPVARFLCTIIRDANDVILGIKFTQV